MIEEIKQVLRNLDFNFQEHQMPNGDTLDFRFIDTILYVEINPEDDDSCDDYYMIPTKALTGEKAKKIRGNEEACLEFFQNVFQSIFQKKDDFCEPNSYTLDLIEKVLKDKDLNWKFKREISFSNHSLNIEVEVTEDIFQNFVIPTYVFTGKESKKRGKEEAYFLYLMQIFTSIKEFNA